MARDQAAVRIAIPGYEDFELLGKGGFSRVWKAYQPRFRRSVAVKILNFDIVDERAIRGFERECHAMGQVSAHPNIVTVLDSGLTSDDQPFIVMEYFAGGTYSDKVAAEVIPIEELLRVGVKIAGALQTAHDAGILHRDLKPHNIFVSRFNEPALGDFGISTIDEERTATGSAGFTVHYAPPEVLDGRPASEQSDVYSLGATFYRLVEGVRPFDGPDQSVVATAVRIINEPVPSITRSDCPPELKVLISQMMSKTEAARPGSAADVAGSFQDIQRKMGFAASEIVLDTDATSPPVPLAGASSVVAADDALTIARADTVDNTESAASMTISRPVAPDDVGDEPPVAKATDEEDDAQESIGAKWMFAGAAAVVLLGILIAWGVVSAGQTTEAVVDTTVFDQDDDLFSQPVTPQEVAASFASATLVEVSWSMTGAKEADVFRVQRVDAGGSTTAAVDVDAPPAKFSGIGQGDVPCFHVSMIRSGRISTPSLVACAQP